MILVTGATGNVGWEVVNLLLEDGQKVAAVTRNPATAALPCAAHVVGDDNEATLGHGDDRVHIRNEL